MTGSERARRGLAESMTETEPATGRTPRRFLYFRLPHKWMDNDSYVLQQRDLVSYFDTVVTSS